MTDIYIRFCNARIMDDIRTHPSVGQAFQATGDPSCRGYGADQPAPVSCVSHRSRAQARVLGVHPTFAAVLCAPRRGGKWQVPRPIRSHKNRNL